MKEQWLKFAVRYDALQLRERWLLAAAMLGGIVLVGYSLFVEPVLKRLQLAERSMTEQRMQISVLQAQRLALQSAEQDPDLVARAELAGVKNQLGEVGGRLEAIESALLPSQRMPSLLEQMIGRDTGLRLLSLRSLPLAPLVDKKTSVDETAPAKSVDKPANPEVGLFKHGVEIKLEGSYQALLSYLERLEQSKSALLWSSLSLSAEKHPKLVLTLTVYTLSLDRAWLIV
ncbi:conserved hypothetical protein [Candidatus Accumulibacter aalborgensis]|uniref:MSHA biogenesis protein MshJ n=1 Tax=Candidatus Accumulibacter aalborgensis TaxID=1860102 RepID=A0A1A8XFQ0_9PROT|nr:type II secretion system protein M [Candidatus Accumulibacter aalborgensis]SBT03182.1 conserved hypothetical protein [Candidatus Accumulibacter aalborgensis]